MKTKIFLVVLLVTAFVSTGQAQKASEGKAVVSHGFENSKKVRFGLLRAYDVGQFLPHVYETVDSLIDSLGVNVTEDWSAVSALKVFYDNQKIVCAGGPFDAGTLDTNLNKMAWAIRQRIYTAAPQIIEGDETIEYGFRYNDINIADSGNWANYHNNTYDTNDINYYVEYPATHAFVTDTFSTLRYPGKNSLVYFGNEGRVILGYSDDRIGFHLLSTPNFYPFQTHPPNSDTAKAFSVNLEFWLDTTKSNIDMSDAATASVDSVPLVRLQVLYKPAGQSVLPFVPFTAGADTNHGWFKCLDTVITRSVYNALPDDWRADDSTFNGTTGYRAHNWRLKQLHTMITLNHVMDSIRQNLVVTGAAFGPTGNSYSNTDFSEPDDTSGGGPEPAVPFVRAYMHPDSLVAYDTNTKTYLGDLFEIRVLSTYRTTVRVRDLTYQDTMVDRYLNRRRFHDTIRNIDTTHSVEQNGNYGGNDDEVNAALNSMSVLMGTNRPREFMYNDNGGSPGASFPALGYLDYMGSKYQIYIHSRPQDGGDISEIYRRARMSLDGQPPSIFESQSGEYYTEILPWDFVYYGHGIERDSLWGHSHLDTLMGQIIARPGATSVSSTDTLVGYKQFAYQQAMQEGTFDGMRKMARVGLWHAWSKRFAPEYSIKDFAQCENASYDSSGWLKWQGYYYHWTHNGIPDSAWILPPHHGYNSNYTYAFPMLTPETITTIIYGSFANGLTSFSAAEAIGNDIGDGFNHSFGIFSPSPHDSGTLALTYTHGYNVGHYYTCRGWNYQYPYGCDVDGPLQNYYLGLSNTYRAFARANERMNAIWDTGTYPVKDFRWLDGYSQYLSHPTLRGVGADAMDSLSRISAFLKVVKTQAVDPWTRQGPDSAYIDNVVDDSDSTDAMVGMFIDSISTSQKNYAALVINPRCWPCRDSTTLAYYNNGLDSISKIHPTLGDIDVRKVYLKLDVTKTNSAFSNHTYYVVRDLWHPDSTWLLNKDSTFAVYIKPGDAKFLYFEPGIAVNVAARTGTDTGKSTTAEFCFNNGRRVAEIEHGTRDVICYTRNHYLYVSYPAAGSTFGGSPDQSSGDNIITGYEQALDTTHFCARPSISAGPNDTSVALTWWYQDSTYKISGLFGEKGILNEKKVCGNFQSTRNRLKIFDSNISLPTLYGAYVNGMAMRTFGKFFLRKAPDNSKIADIASDDFSYIHRINLRSEQIMLFKNST